MERTEEPTQHRIDEFRRRGDVASSRELTSVLVLSASLLALLASSSFVYETLASFVQWLYTRDLVSAFEPGRFPAVVDRSVRTLLLCAGPLCLIAFCAAVLSNVAQVGLLFSPDVLSLKWGRINPAEGAKRLFTAKSAVEALKGILKFVFVIAIVALFMRDELTTFTGYLHTELADGLAHGKYVVARMVAFVIAGLLAIALLDLAYQKSSYQSKLRMTKDELKRERKEHEGNPEIRQRIRNIQKEMSKRRMSEEVRRADVVVTNPEHVSVALRYDPGTMGSPLVVAKGVEHLALMIRRIAREARVPVVENVPLARSLYGTVRVGDMVPRELYKAVAEVLAFVYRLAGRSAGAAAGAAAAGARA